MSLEAQNRELQIFFEPQKQKNKIFGLEMLENF